MNGQFTEIEIQIAIKHSIYIVSAFCHVIKRQWDVVSGAVGPRNVVCGAACWDDGPGPVWGAHQHTAGRHLPFPSLPCGVCSKIKFITNFLGCFVSTQPHTLTRPGSLGGKAAVLNALLRFQRVFLESCLPVGSLCVTARALSYWGGRCFQPGVVKP